MASIVVGLVGSSARRTIVARLSVAGICVFFWTLSYLLGAQGPDSARGTADALLRGRRILERAQQAMGGADKIAAVKDVIHTMEIALEASAGGFKMKQVSRYVAPGQIRHEQETPFGKITVYSDGKSGWLGTPQGIQAIPPDVLKLAKGVIFRQPTVLVLSDQDISRSVNAVGDNEVKISTSDGQSVLMQFDPVTGLPSRQVYIESDVNRGSVERVELLSDWRDAGGIKMPYRAVQQENGVKTLEVTISEYRFNSGITSDDLSQKPTN